MRWAYQLLERAGKKLLERLPNKQPEAFAISPNSYIVLRYALVPHTKALVSLFLWPRHCCLFLPFAQRRLSRGAHHGRWADGPQPKQVDAAPRGSRVQPFAVRHAAAGERRPRGAPQNKPQRVHSPPPRGPVWYEHTKDAQKKCLRKAIRILTFFRLAKAIGPFQPPAPHCALVCVVLSVLSACSRVPRAPGDVPIIEPKRRVAQGAEPQRPRANPRSRQVQALRRGIRSNAVSAEIRPQIAPIKYDYIRK